MLNKSILTSLVLYVFSLELCAGIYVIPREDRFNRNRQAPRPAPSSRGDLPDIPEYDINPGKEADPLFTVDFGLGIDSSEEDYDVYDGVLAPNGDIEEERIDEVIDEMEQKELWEGKEETTERPRLFDYLPHWMHRRNSRFHHGIGGHLNLLPNIQVNWDWSLEFGRSNWWKGPNVCQREEESEEIREPRTNGIVRHHVTATSVCDDTWSAYKCTTEVKMINVTKKYSLIYECCHGYQRESGKSGCTKELPMRSLMETLDAVGASDTRQALEGISLTKILQTKNYTIFTPSDGLLEHFKAVKDAGSNVVVVTPDLVEMARALEETVLSHVVEGLVKTTHMEDEQLLPTLNAGHDIRINMYDGRTKLMTANCRPITSSDNLADNGVVHVVDGILPPVRDTIASIVTSNPDLSMFKTLIGQSGVLSMLRRGGQYTLLAPSNTAFSRLDPYVREQLLSGHMCLQDVLRNHLLPNVICSGILDGNQLTINVLNEYLQVAREHGKLFVEGGQILETDLMATNGVVHIIDKVLVPTRAMTMPDVLSQMNATMMLELVQEAGLTEEFTRLSDYTAFVPSDQALRAMDQVDLAALRGDPARLREVLMYHIVNSTEKFDDFIHGSQLDTHKENHRVLVNTYQSIGSMFGWGGGKKSAAVECALIEKPDIETCGGVMHVIDRMITPTASSVVDILRDDGRFTLFMELLNMTTLADQLTTYDKVTVFAPTDEAFESLNGDTIDYLLENPDKLTSFLKHHFVEGAMCCASMNTPFLRTSFKSALDGGMMMISKHRRQLFINNSPVTDCDQVAADGVVHAIDTVLETAVYTYVTPYLALRGVKDKVMAKVIDATDRLDTYLSELHDRLFGPRVPGESERDREMGLFGLVDKLEGLRPNSFVTGIVHDSVANRPPQDNGHSYHRRLRGRGANTRPRRIKSSIKRGQTLKAKERKQKRHHRNGRRL